MKTTTLPRPCRPLRVFLTSGALASALVFGNLAVQAVEMGREVMAGPRDDSAPKQPEGSRHLELRDCGGPDSGQSSPRG